MNKTTIIGILIVILVAGIIGASVLFFNQDIEEEKLLEEQVGYEEEETIGEDISEIANWITYRNEEYGFKIKYPYYLFDVDYNPESLKAFFPVNKDTGLIKKIFSIDIREGEYNQSIDFYCEEGAPHSNLVNIDDKEFCEYRAYEEVKEDKIFQYFPVYHAIHNKKWITFKFEFIYCSPNLSDDCDVLFEIDEKETEKEFNQILSTIQFLD